MKCLPIYCLFYTPAWALHTYPENLYYLLFPFRWRGGSVLFKVPAWHHQGAENLQRRQTAKGETLWKPHSSLTTLTEQRISVTLSLAALFDVISNMTLISDWSLISDNTFSHVVSRRWRMLSWPSTAEWPQKMSSKSWCRSLDDPQRSHLLKRWQRRMTVSAHTQNKL